MKVGIAGATAYTSLELIKLLLRHPEAEIAYLGARREGNPRISQIFPSLKQQIDLPTAGLEPEDIPKGVELVFVTL
ncbi:MAG TPA: N-acetyl-gamma-glutamyl-phosphate reductase, partial [Candidatus Avalokitesvara rifleensis]